ncbi:MAG: hypothetical protein EOO77_22005 [Oxalobacteraceae bacterium]|nr:MAG: hypothetical protein EOO77_22005 [Oxalobacteraceae bacterium]
MQLSLPLDRIALIVEGCAACGLDLTLRFFIPKVQERYNPVTIQPVYQTLEETAMAGPPRDTIGTWCWARISEEDFTFFELRFRGVIDYLVQR